MRQVLRICLVLVVVGCGPATGASPVPTAPRETASTSPTPSPIRPTSPGPSAAAAFPIEAFAECSPITKSTTATSRSPTGWPVRWSTSFTHADRRRPSPAGALSPSPASFGLRGRAGYARVLVYQHGYRTRISQVLRAGTITLVTRARCCSPDHWEARGATMPGNSSRSTPDRNSGECIPVTPS